MLWYASHMKELDKYHSWWIPGKVYTIAAYSNVGKSRFSYWYINEFLKQWKKVVIISLEVDKWLLIQHLACNRYNKYSKDLTEDDIDILDFQNLLIFDDVYSLYDIEDIISFTKPDFCVIDFVQNIQVPWSTWYEAMATVAKKIQEIAIKTNTCMISLSQLSNETAKEVTRGNTSFIALKGAGELVASSDVVLILSMFDGDIMVTVAKTKFAHKPEDPLLYKTDFGRSIFTYSRIW